MREEKKGLSEKLSKLLTKEFDITADELTFIPIGEESFSYKATAGNEEYLVKFLPDITRKDAVSKSNNLLLELNHLPFVVAPLKSITDETTVEVADGFITVSPFVEGELVNGNNESFSKQLVNDLTDIVIQIHNATSNIQTELKEEEFTTAFEANYMQVLELAKKHPSKKFAKLAKKNEKKIQELITHHMKESEYYKQFTPHFFVIHGDITQFNILQTSSGIKLLDWDEAMLAPKEADLIFFVDNKRFDEKKYLDEVNQEQIDEKLIEYYKMRWSLNSIVLGLHEVATKKFGEEDEKAKLAEVEEYLGYY